MAEKNPNKTGFLKITYHSHGDHTTIINHGTAKNCMPPIYIETVKRLHLTCPPCDYPATNRIREDVNKISDPYKCDNRLGAQPKCNSGRSLLLLTAALPFCVYFSFMKNHKSDSAMRRRS